MTWQELAGQVRAGVYEHYKGDRYLVHGLARDDAGEDAAANPESVEPFVIYTRLYERPGIPTSARRLSEFLGEVDTEIGRRPRFTFIGPASS